MPPNGQALLALGASLVAGYFAFSAVKKLFKSPPKTAKGKDGIQNHKTYVPYTGEIPGNVKELFQEATSLVSSGKFNFDMEEQLALYGLYKAATAGHCVGTCPSSLNFEARAKWDAWSECRGLEKDEAMWAYVQLLERIVPADTLEATREKVLGKKSASSQTEDDEEEEESIFMTDAEYEEHLQKVKDRSRGIGFNVSTEAPQLSHSASAPSKTEILQKITSILQKDDVESLHQLIQSIVGDELSAQKDFIEKPVAEGKDSFLLLAVDSGAVKIVDEILRVYTPPVNIVGNDGLTPLHMALYLGSPEIAMSLTQHGADATKPDESDESALELYYSLHDDDKQLFSQVLPLWAQQLVDKQQQEQAESSA